MRHAPVTELEVVEDFTSTSRCDEGYLHVRRLRVRNRRADGTHSPAYRVDVIDRPQLDAVAVVVWRRRDDHVELLTRQNLRPAAFLRHSKVPPVPDPRSYLYCEEIVAGLLEESDRGEAGLKHRAVTEVLEEAGYRVSPDAVTLLGAPFFVAPGIISEKIFLTAVEVTGVQATQPNGDGSPLEEGGVVRWRTAEQLLAAIANGEVQDAKTELGLNRLLALLSRP